MDDRDGLGLTTPVGIRKTTQLADRAAGAKGTGRAVPATRQRHDYG